MLSPAFFAKLDENDPLAGHRDRFHVPEGVVYLDGNSLGALPRETSERVRALIEAEWGVSLIKKKVAAGNKMARQVESLEKEILATVEETIAKKG